MQPGEITMSGHGSNDAGDVVTDDGEVIGRWTVDDSDYYQFFLDGSEVHLLSSYHLGIFCREITKWHDGQREPKG